MKDKIKKYLMTNGADVCGIANIDRFTSAPQGFSPKDIFSECQSVVTFGIALSKGLTHVESRLIYGHFNYDVCHEIDRLSLKAAKYIEQEFKATAVPIPSDSPYEYWDEENMKGKGLISMKHTAVICGLGEMGKNSLLINPSYGNLLTLGAILTDLPMESDPTVKNLCIKGCHKCMDACPVQAIENGEVNQKRCRTNTYGKTARGFDTVDCNKCRMACPMRFGSIGR